MLDILTKKLFYYFIKFKEGTFIKNIQRLLLILSLFFVAIFMGVIVYMNLLDVNFIDVLYMITITISTVGRGEVEEIGLIVLALKEEGE